MNEEHDLIKSSTETAKIKYVSFKGKYHRYDLAIINSKRFLGKKVVLDLRESRFGILDRDEIEKNGNLEHQFNLNEMEAEELRIYLRQIV